MQTKKSSLELFSAPIKGHLQPCTRRSSGPKTKRLHFIHSGRISGRDVRAEKILIHAQENGSNATFESSCEFEVRDYELDQFGVVNNAIYLQYLQHGRHKFLQAINIDIDAIARAGNALALSEINVVFRAPLRSADRVRCTCRCGKISAAKVTFEQNIFKLPQSSDGVEQKVLEATAIVVSLDSRYKPRRMPKQVIEALKTGQAADNIMDYFF